MGMLIKAKEIYLQDEILNNGNLYVDDKKIAGVNTSMEMDNVIDLKNLRLIPGLVDIHVHGGNGYDVMDGTYEAINEISKFKLKEGVTSFCPTTVTAEFNRIQQAVRNIAHAMDVGVEGAKIIGTFVEGPYITSKYRGAHKEALIRDLDIHELEALFCESKDTIKTIAIAPEKDNSLEAIRYIHSKGAKIALGHTDATYAQMEEAIEAGASIGIHAYNGMRPLHHREPGALGAILNKDEIIAELISDTHHVCGHAIEILVRCKGVDRVALVTDCMMAGGLEDGAYILGELPVHVEAGVARIENGSLAGSTLALNQGIMNLCNQTNVSLRDAINMATIVPATAVDKASEIGSIAINKRADLVGINDKFEVKFVMVEGRIVLNEI